MASAQDEFDEMLSSFSADKLDSKMTLGSDRSQLGKPDTPQDDDKEIDEFSAAPTPPAEAHICRPHQSYAARRRVP